MDLNHIKDYLAKEGYRPDLDDDGDICFKSEGKTYYISCYKDDEHFVRLIAPKIWSIDSDEERIQADRMASQVNCAIKCAKVFAMEPGRENVWATLEMFVPDANAFTPVFHRCLGALDGAVQDFLKGMQETVATQEPTTEKVDGMNEAPETDDEAERPVLYNIYRSLCLSGDLEGDIMDAYLKVLETTEGKNTAATLTRYLEDTKTEARKALGMDDLDFLDVTFPERAVMTDIEAAYRILWDKAKQQEDIPMMASVRLSMMAILGNDRQRDLIGTWK